MTSEKRKTPFLTVLLFVLAAGLLLFSTVAAARAALIYGAEPYIADIEMMTNGIAIVENGTTVSDGKLLKGITESPVPGKPYAEALSVINSGDPAKGDIDQYIRVQIFKYWVDEDGKKNVKLDPALIELNLVTDTGWIVDTAASTVERTVLYYKTPVKAGAQTTAFSDTITVSETVLTDVTQTVSSSTDAGGRTTYTYVTTFFYDGKQICLEVVADGVQTHHAADAILSAWGRSVSVAGDGSISLN